LEKTTPNRTCQRCRTRQPVENFPHDKWARPDTRQCLECEDQETPVLLTASEAKKRLGTIPDWLKPAGSYTPPKGESIPLYSRDEIDNRIGEPYA
jgi:hypothetical protein